jgi:hypothetical protein
MAEQAGYLNEVYVLAGDTPMTGSTGAKVNGIDNSTYNDICAMLDITAFGHTRMHRKTGLKDGNVTISGNLYTSDTNGQAVITAGAALYIGVYPEGTGVAGTQLAALVESVGKASVANGKQTFTATLQGSGDDPVALPLRT